jgi:hypothetical protein
MNGYIEAHGSAQQIAALLEDEEFERNTVDASLIVQDLRHVVGHTNEGVARQIALYQEALSKVPQTT